MSHRISRNFQNNFIFGRTSRSKNILIKHYLSLKFCKSVKSRHVLIDVIDMITIIIKARINQRKACIDVCTLSASVAKFNTLIQIIKFSAGRKYSEYLFKIILFEEFLIQKLPKIRLIQSLSIHFSAYDEFVR